jgi:hypothetical protein
MVSRTVGRGTRRGLSVCALAGMLSAVICVTSVSTAVAAPPAAGCQPFSGKPCLFPYPDNRLTRTDRTSATGLRVSLPAAAMPSSAKGVRIQTGPYDRNDGFSPGSTIVLHIPGLDNAAALRRTGAVALTDMAASLARRQPIVLIDQATGQRQLIWAELDANARGAANTPRKAAGRGAHVHRRAA